MTCIVAITDKKSIWMGADTMISSPGIKLPLRNVPKIFDREVEIIGKEPVRMLIGGCGHYKMIHILHYHLHPPAIDSDQTVDIWLGTTFTQHIRQIFKDHAFMKEDDGAEHIPEGSLLVGMCGELRIFNDDLSSYEIDIPYASIGSGESYAFGSLYSTRKLEMTPKKRIKEALNAAAHFDPLVSAPFQIVGIQCQK